MAGLEEEIEILRKQLKELMRELEIVEDGKMLKAKGNTRRKR